MGSCGNNYMKRYLYFFLVFLNLSSWSYADNFSIQVNAENPAASQSYIQKINQLLKEASRLKENQGVGFLLGGSAIAGTGLQFEVLDTQGMLSFYCSSYATVTAEYRASVYTGLQAISTRGCTTPNYYEGLFMTLSGALGVDLFAGAGVFGTASYGFDYGLLQDTIRNHFIKNPSNIFAFLKEADDLLSCSGINPVHSIFVLMIDATILTLEQLTHFENFDNNSKIKITNGISHLKETLKHISKTPAERLNHSKRCSSRALSMLMNTKDLINIYKSEVKDNSYSVASMVLPSKKILSWAATRYLEESDFPFLRKLILEIVNRDMSGCDSVTAGIGASLGTPTGLNGSIGVAFSNYKKLGESFPIRNLRETVIDRYVTEGGASNLLSDATITLNQVCKVGSKAKDCVWNATCSIAKDPVGSAKKIANRAKTFIDFSCQKTSALITGFLNAAKTCVNDNYAALKPELLFTKGPQK